MENNNDEQDILKPEGELETLNQDSEENADENNEGEDVDIEELKKKASLADNYKIRAERAEKLAKQLKSQTKTETNSSDLSTKDLYALIDAKVPESDIDEVREYAQLKKISIAEALKSTVVKSILSDNAEKRKSAEVSSTGSSKRSSGKISDAVLLEKAMKGELPDSQEDMERLFNLRKGI
jgi:hypothetical protein